jgi:hypothetical protein
MSELDAKLQAAAGRNVPVNLVHMLWALTLDVMVDFIFDVELGSINEQDLSVRYGWRGFRAPRLAALFKLSLVPSLANMRNAPGLRNLNPFQKLEMVSIQRNYLDPSNLGTAVETMR